MLKNTDIYELLSTNTINQSTKSSTKPPLSPLLKSKKSPLLSNMSPLSLIKLYVSSPSPLIESRMLPPSPLIRSRMLRLFDEIIK